MEDFEKYNSNSSSEILIALATDLGNMANAIFPKLDCGYFSEEEEKKLSFYYQQIAKMQKTIIAQLRERGEI
tara:strand:- start:296 stop:511 length:216 start_codon:yes stop_codon:yes gene_type:complete